MIKGFSGEMYVLEEAAGLVEEERIR